MIKISPSILACDFFRLGEEAAAMENSGADMLHLDVMDGHFVPNISFGAPVVKSLRSRLKIRFDAHLMITRPLCHIHDFAEAGADIITFHIEASSPANETIDAILKEGAVPGIALRPATPAEAVFPYMERLGMVVVMTVEPGFCGQGFMSDMLPKIRAIRARADALGIGMDIQADGGVDRKTAAAAAAAGANVLVTGSYIFRQTDYSGALSELKGAGKP